MYHGGIGFDCAATSTSLKSPGPAQVLALHLAALGPAPLCLILISNERRIALSSSFYRVESILLTRSITH